MNIDFIFILFGMNTLIVFLFKREWLLEKNTFLLLLAANIFLFIAGYILEAKQMIGGNPKLVLALKMPLLSQLLFICMVICFRKIYKRNPVDTFWTMDKKLMKDGVFNFVFWVVGVLLPTILVFTKTI
jgi:hypothetical protein